jgi:uncharacterized protein YjbI with pentapeptide repeats
MDKKSTTAKGTELEKEIIPLYQELGATLIKHNSMLGGNQVDVYVEMPTFDGILIRYAIDCKNYQSNITKDIASAVCTVFTSLKQTHLIDIGIILTTIGCSADARTVADSHGVQIMLISELKKRLFDITPHVTKLVKRYESTDLFQKKTYIEQRAKLIKDNDADEKIIDKDLLNYVLSSKCGLIFVLGDCGSGKSTFVHTLAYQLAKSEKQSEKHYIPLLIDLREYRSVRNLDAVLSHIFTRDGVLVRNIDRFYSLLRDSKLFIIMDAFDEMIIKSERTEVSASFDEILKLVKDNGKIIINCRTQYFRHHEEFKEIYLDAIKRYGISETQVEILELLPFRDEDVKRYLSKVLPDKWDEYYSQIKNTAHLIEFAEKPMLLELICKTLPSIDPSTQIINPAILYLKYINQWLKRDDWRTSLNYEERERLSEEFAFEIFDKDLPGLHYYDIPQWLQGRLATAPSRTELEHLEYDFRNCTFLKRNKQGLFYFAHNSYRDFLVSKGFKRKFESIDVFPLNYNKATEEIMEFTKQLLVADTSFIDRIKQNVFDRRIKLEDKVKIIRIIGFGGTQISGIIDKDLIDYIKASGNWNFFGLDNLNIVQMIQPKLEIDSAKLSNINIIESDLSGTNINYSAMNHIICDKLKLSYSTIKYSQLTDCQFPGNDMSYCTFIHVDFHNSDFKETDLTGTSFRSCNLSNTNFWRANLNKSKFLTCNLESSRFSEAKELSSSDFKSCNLRNAQFLNIEVRKPFMENLKTNNGLEGAKFDPDILDQYFSEPKYVKPDFQKPSEVIIRKKSRWPW